MSRLSARFEPFAASPSPPGRGRPAARRTLHYVPNVAPQRLGGKRLTKPMPVCEAFRHLDATGVPARQIARRLGISRNTVAKYAEITDCSPKPQWTVCLAQARGPGRTVGQLRQHVLIRARSTAPYRSRSTPSPTPATTDAAARSAPPAR